ncbi:MAG: FAD-dependent oxidoreductase, partial [Kiritimatiellia bacterium]
MKKIPPSPRSPDRQPRECALSRKTGITARPRDFDWFAKNVPCQAACPAGTDIPGYLDAVARGDLDAAYRINLADNVFPAVLGRVCTRPCEPACRHGWPGLGEPVAVCFAKRSSDDFRARTGPVVLPPLFADSGKRVAVIGAGAAGLAAARDLRRLGHAVTVYEQHTAAGGMMVQGIPAFRLPRDVVEREIAQIGAAGVVIRCGVEIGRDLSLDQLRKENDAVLIAAGCLRPVRPDSPGAALGGVWHGLDFLRAVNGGKDVATGRRVVVVGGGFTAVDCARMARRLGAEDCLMVYRRTRDEMYVAAHELAEFEKEGVGARFQLAPVEILGREGVVTGIRFARTEPGSAGPDGRRTWVAVPGEEVVVECDSVLLATGQARGDGWAEHLAGADPAVFVAGDVRTGPRSLIDAIGDGRRVALEMDEFLTGAARLKPAFRIQDSGRGGTGRARELNDLPRQAARELPPERRGPEDEVELGLDAAAARTEASRCYLCNVKFEIDNDLCIYCD